MNPLTIKKLDTIFGKFLCAGLTFYRKLTSIIKRNNTPVKKVLFIKFIEQGATVLAYNAIKKAVDRVGRENVYFAVFEENRFIIDLLEIIPEENVFAIRNRGLFIFLIDTLGVLLKLRKLKIDATIDLEFFTRAPVIFAYLSGAKYRVGFHRFNSELPYRGDLLTHRVQYNPYLHITEICTMLTEALWAQTDEYPLLKKYADWKIENAPDFKASAKEIKNTEDLLFSLGIRNPYKPVILLNPNAGDMLPIRKWDPTNFIELGKKLSAGFQNATILITGAPSEEKCAIETAKAICKENVYNVAGKTTLRQLFVLYTLSDLLITNDSGPGLFSTLTGIDSIILFGPETPRLFGSKSEKTHIIWKNLACSPCVNVFNHRFSPCKNNLCMKSITVDEVYNLADEILKKRLGKKEIYQENFKSAVKVQ